MKKYLILCLIICMAILSGCGGRKDMNGPTKKYESYLNEKYEHITLKIIGNKAITIPNEIEIASLKSSKSILSYSNLITLTVQTIDTIENHPQPIQHKTNNHNGVIAPELENKRMPKNTLKIIGKNEAIILRVF